MNPNFIIFEIIFKTVFKPLSKALVIYSILFESKPQYNFTMISLTNID